MAEFDLLRKGTEAQSFQHCRSEDIVKSTAKNENRLTNLGGTDYILLPRTAHLHSFR